MCKGPVCDLACPCAARVHDPPIDHIGSKYSVKFYAQHAKEGQDLKDANHDADRLAALQQETLEMQQAFVDEQSALHSCKQRVQS